MLRLYKTFNGDTYFLTNDVAHYWRFVRTKTGVMTTKVFKMPYPQAIWKGYKEICLKEFPKRYHKNLTNLEYLELKNNENIKVV